MTAAVHSLPAASGFPYTAWRQIRRGAPLGVVVLAHVGFFFAMRHGLIHEPPHTTPREVVATFVTPDAPPEAAPSQPAAPKAVPAVKKTVTPPKPSLKPLPKPPPKPLPAPAKPVVDESPSPQTAAAPPAGPAPAQSAAPAQPAVAAAPAPVTSAQPPKTISSGIEYLEAPQSAYPPAAKRMGEEGTAILRVLVNEKGRPERIEMQKSSGSPRLDDAARRAVQRAIFKPFMENGKAVAAFAIVPITFQLDS